MLNQRSLTQKSTQCIIPLIRSKRTGEINLGKREVRIMVASGEIWKG